MINKLVNMPGILIKVALRSPMLKNAGVTFFLRVSGAGLLFIFNWLIVKLLGVEGSGVFFLAFTILNVFSVLFLFGVDQHVLRRIAALKNQKDSYAFFLKGGLYILISSVVGGIILFLLANPLGSVFKSPSLVPVIMILALTMPFITLTTFLGMAVRAKKKFVHSVFILTNSYYLISILVFAVLWFLGSVDLDKLSWAFFLAMVSSFSINLYLTSRVYRLSDILQNIHAHKNVSLKKLTKDSHQLFLVSVIYLGFGSLNVLLVGFFLPESSVSIYSVAEKIAKLLTFSLFAINMILAPSISRYFAENNYKKLNREIQKATILSVVFAFPLFIIFIIFPEWFLGIFGQEYIAGANILRLLTIGQAVNAATGAVLITMIMTNQDKKINQISISTLGLELLIGLVLIPQYGLIGAAWTAAIGWSLVNIIGAYYLKRYASINVFPTVSVMKELLKNAKNSIG